jgi:hypothetical protein
MKPLSNPQMKAWNQEAAAGDLAPEARQTIAHGETVGKMRDGFKPRMGRKKNLLRDEIRFSPRHGFSNTRQSFITGNGFHATAANFIAAAKSFRRPESVNLFVLHGIKAFHETVGEAVRAPIFSACIWPICDFATSAIARGWTLTLRRASTCCSATTRRARRTSLKHFQSLFAFTYQMVLISKHECH